MEQLQNEEIKEDEISLLDLIVVIVKYRKLIIWGTILVSVLACMFLVFLPNFDKDKDEYYIVDYNIPLYPNMNNFGNFISFDITEDVQTKINDRNFIAEINKKSLVFDYDFEAPSFNTLDYNQYIFNLFKDNYYVAKLSNTKSNILLSIKTTNQENADLFVNSANEYMEYWLSDSTTGQYTHDNVEFSMRYVYGGRMNGACISHQLLYYAGSWGDVWDDDALYREDYETGNAFSLRPIVLLESNVMGNYDETNEIWNLK